MAMMSYFQTPREPKGIQLRIESSNTDTQKYVFLDTVH
jgi:hypothetical protein